MKKNLGHYSTVSNKPKIKLAQIGKCFFNSFNRQIRIFSLAFVSLFLVSSFTSAQPTAEANTVNNPDITTGLLKDSKSITKTEKKELREERQSIREVEDIPQATFARFKSDFPGATDVEWSAPQGYPEVNFIMHNKKMVADYDYSNHLLGSGRFLSYNQLPARGRKQIAKDYPGFSPEKVIAYHSNANNDLNMALDQFPIQTNSYFTQLKKGNKTVVVQVDRDGEISYFGEME